jgi:protein TonB
MTPAPTTFGMTRTELIRWATCFTAIFALHCAVAAAIIVKPSEGDVLDEIDAIEVDFTTASFENAPPRDVAPGEEQIQTEQAPPPMEQAVEKKEQEEEEPVEEKPAEPVEKAEIEPEIPPAPDPEVALAATPPPPPKPEEQEEKKEEVKTPSAAPPVISSSVTTAPTATAARRAAMVSWKRKLALHLQRNKRYPAAAQARREHGTAQVSFVVDRHGHVIRSRLVKGTGSEALDHETLALLQRAQPLPTPPADVTGTQFAFSVPFRFDLQ